MNWSASEIYGKCEARPINHRHHGWFVAYAPADNPEIVVAALAEHSCHGSTGAGPMVRDTMRAYFDKYHPDVVAAGLAKMKSTPKSNKVEPIPVVEGD